jgi:hypothetical protein
MWSYDAKHCARLRGLHELHSPGPGAWVDCPHPHLHPRCWRGHPCNTRQVTGMSAYLKAVPLSCHLLNMDALRSNMAKVTRAIPSAAQWVKQSCPFDFDDSCSDLFSMPIIPRTRAGVTYASKAGYYYTGRCTSNRANFTYCRPTPAPPC